MNDWSEVTVDDFKVAPIVVYDEGSEEHIDDLGVTFLFFFVGK